MWNVLVHLSRLGGMQAVIALTAIVRNKVLAIRLGAEGYGEFSQILLIAMTASILVGLGLELSLNRSVAATEDHGARQRLLSQANTINVTMGLTIVLGMIGLITFRPDLLGLAGIGWRPEIIAAFVILILQIPFDAAARQRIAFLTTVMDIKGLTTGRSIAVIVGTAIAIPIVWYFWLIGAAVQVALITLILFVTLNRRCRKLGYRPLVLLFDWQVFKELVTLGLASVFLGFTYYGGDVLMRSILIKSSGIADNGIYNAATAIVRQVVVALSSVGSYSIAVLSREQSQSSIGESAGDLLMVVLPLATLVFGGLGMLSGIALLIAYSREFIGAQSVMPLLLFGEFLWIAVRVIGAPFVTQNRIGLWLGLEVIFIVVQVATAVLLVPRYGMMGMAIAFAGASLLHFLLTTAAFFGLGYRIKPAQLVMIGMGAAIVLVLGYLGTLHVFDLPVVLLGGVILGLYVAAVVHMTVGLPAALTRVRTMLSRKQA